MLPKPPPLLLIVVLLVIAQLSCVRPGNSETASAPASSFSPVEKSPVDQILDRYEQALGGKEAIAAITSLKLKGTYEIAGLSGPLEVWRKGTEKTLSIVEFPRIGKLKKGFDGTTRWVQTPIGTYSDNSPQEIAELEHDAEVFGAGRIKSLFEKMKLGTKSWLGEGREAYMIEGVPAKGPPEKLFFDTTNGLLVRWDMARHVPNHGFVFVKVHLDDYRDVGGVKMPFNVRFVFESFNFRIKVDEMQHNIPIDDAIFTKP